MREDGQLTWKQVAARALHDRAMSDVQPDAGYLVLHTVSVTRPIYPGYYYSTPIRLHIVTETQTRDCVCGLNRLHTVTIDYVSCMQLVSGMQLVGTMYKEPDR